MGWNPLNPGYPQIDYILLPYRPVCHFTTRIQFEKTLQPRLFSILDAAAAVVASYKVSPTQMTSQFFLEFSPGQ